MTRNGGGEHIVPSPQYVAAFVHATGLSVRQLLSDTKTMWGPVEWVEYKRLIQEKLRATPEDKQLAEICHDIQLLWDKARQTAMERDRFPTGT